MKCDRCGKENPAEIHTCSPQMRGSMTRDDVLRIAREADLWVTGMQPYQAQIEKFAALVAAHEREQCALVAEELRPSKPEYDQRFYDGCTFAAMAIRNRGEK